MPSFTLTNLAKADLKEIGPYTQKHWGRDQRNLYLGMPDASFRQLADNLLAGKDCSDIRDGYRKFRTGSHVIFYRGIPGNSGDTILNSSDTNSGEFRNSGDIIFNSSSLLALVCRVSATGRGWSPVAR